MRTTITSALILVNLVAVQSMFGQGNATIVGVVSDSTSAAVAGAHVTLINEGTGIRASAVSDSAGRYNFPQLAVGNYRVEVVSPGFKRATQSGVNLTVGQISAVNVTLEVGDVKESIEVAGAPPALETVSAFAAGAPGAFPNEGRNALYSEHVALQDDQNHRASTRRVRQQYEQLQHPIPRQVARPQFQNPEQRKHPKGIDQIRQRL